MNLPSLRLRRFFPERILCISAHPDDVEFGCGGLISRFQGRADIQLLVLTDHNLAADGTTTLVRIREESYAAAGELGLQNESVHFESLSGQRLPEQTQKLREILLGWRGSFAPDLVLCPPARDIHQDHRATCDEAIRIFRYATVVGYEVLNSSQWFTPSLYVQLEMEHIDKKVAAVSCYQSQRTPPATTGHYFHPEMIRGLALFRGAQSGGYWAEAFEVYFMSI